jgi:hypothetical protein
MYDYRTPTIYGATLDAALRLRLPLNIKEKSTINEALGIRAAQSVGVLSANNLPSIKLFCVGSGGVTSSTRNDGTIKNACLPHFPEDAGFYGQKPLILRDLNNDLTLAQQQNYRLKKVITVNGVNKIAYYGKVIDFSNTTVAMSRVIANTSPSEFIPNDSNLLPPVRTLTTGQVVTTTSDYLLGAGIISFGFTPWESEEYLNVWNTIYGDSSIAYISEIGICSGVDLTVTGNFNGTSTTYTETQSVQVTSFIGDLINIKTPNDQFTKSYAIGADSPLMTIV